MLKRCCDCKKEIRQRKAKKVKHEWYCPTCYVALRKKHRENTLKEAGIQEEIKELERKAKKESEEKHREKRNEWHRQRYRESHPNSRTYNKTISLEKEFPKKVNHKKPRENNNNYLTLEEKRFLFGQLIKSGMDGFEAKERISLLTNQLKDIRDKMKLRNKSEEEIKTKQQRMIERLYAM